MKTRIRLRRPRLRIVLIAVAILFLGGAVGAGIWVHNRYAVLEVMSIPVAESSMTQYPEDPGARSVHLCEYAGRTLTLVQKEETRFDFVFESNNPQTARVVFRDIDVSLMTPSEPAWTKDDRDLERIALIDRQWNRQQVRFPADSPHIEVTGGNGWEREHLETAELAKNCLNAGLWEVILTVREDGSKKAYYHGWFTFPLGHYKRIFERSTGRAYLDHWYSLEHWSDPEGTPVALEKLREVQSEHDAPVSFDSQEELLVAGEQIRKRRTLDAKNVLTWGDFFGDSKVRFAAFIPPGRYSVSHPRNNEYWRLARFEKGVLRKVVSPVGDRIFDEVELVFSDTGGRRSRFIVSGVDLHALPQLPTQEYPSGLYMPMGIGVPPFYQTYDDLEQRPPDKSPYFSVLLDEDGRWLNHHDIAIDGPVLHRDAADPNRVHLYLLSYERHSLVGHFEIALMAEGET